MPNLVRLHTILTYRRCHASAGESLFYTDVLAPFKPTPLLDDKGVQLAFVIDVATPLGVVPPVLWCAHIDTMHSGTAPTGQTPIYDDVLDMYSKEDGEPLGADDGAGVWLLLEMIDAGVPGSYIFHRAEECGGLGSSGMVKHHREWLSRFLWAIAFDRRGTTDVITRMSCGTVCSDEFALALAAKLNAGDEGFAYEPDDTGSFTDTANYIRIIPECCNVSVGYDYEHSAEEILDVAHVTRLRNVVIKAFAEGINLPIIRDKTYIDPPRVFSYPYVSNGDFYTPPTTKLSRKIRRKLKKAHAIDWTDRDVAPQNAEDVIAMPRRDLHDFIMRGYVEDVVELLYSLADDVLYLTDKQETEDELRDTTFDRGSAEAAYEGLDAYPRIESDERTG